MTDAQAHAVQVKALRTVRQYLRREESLAEELERQLDRLISGKRKIRPAAYLELGQRWTRTKAAVESLDRALADGIRAGAL